MKIRKDVFISTFIIVIGIFVLGLYLGSKLDSYRIDDLKAQIGKSELDAESFIIEMSFADSFSENKCEILRPIINELSGELGEIGKTLTKYDSKGIFDKNEYNILKRRYFILEIRAYTLRKELKEKCGEDNNVILYFYDVNNNEESLRQGYVLDSMVNRNQNITVFSIDREFKEPLLDTVKRHYNVTKGPTIIINFDRKFEGFTPEAEIVKYAK